MRKILMFMAIVVFAMSCDDQGAIQQTKKNPGREEIELKLEQAGFDLSQGFYEHTFNGEKGYLVEYDIFLTIDQIEHLQEGNPSGRTKHYRTNNLVNGRPRTITVFMDSQFDSWVQARFDEALARYNALNIGLTFVRATSASADIRFFADPNLPAGVLGSSGGFPSSNGNPAPTTTLNPNYINGTLRRDDTVLTIVHEIGHAIGFRHTDFMDRTFSNCQVNAQNPADEGSGSNGAVHIPGTPTSPSANSWMLACSNGFDRPFTSQDIIALNAVYPSTLVYSGAQWLDGPFNYPGHVSFPADVTGDGLTDMVIVNPSTERMLVWTNTGSAFSTGAQWIDGPYAYAGHVFTAGDVTGDGKADVVAINPATERMLVWRSTGTGFANGAQWIDGPFVYNNHVFQVADVNGDGKADVVGIDPSSERFLVWLSNSSGTAFLNGAEWINGPFSYNSHIFTVGDVTGDGKADVTAIDPGTGRILVWASTGSSFASGAQWRPASSTSYPNSSFHIGDMNGDGKGDFICTQPSDEKFIVWTAGTNSFNAPLDGANGMFVYSGYGFGVGKFNSDAKADIVGFSVTDERAIVWLTK